MRIAFIIRSTLYSVPGGDTVQIVQTAKWLRELGVEVDILLTNDPIDYNSYDGFHFFNINRPADILFHTEKITKPFFISPILVDYSEYDQQHRKGLAGFVLRQFSPSGNEYIKTMSRWLKGKDSLRTRSYTWKGQKKSSREILKKAAAILPNSEAEQRDMEKKFTVEKPVFIIPNGIDTTLFVPGEKNIRDDKLVICAARIEGIKNQLNLVKALNDTAYTLMLIGSPAPNQRNYYESCRRAASKNILFINHVSQEELIAYYKKACVHVLPSWFETCGLSSLEAAAMGCNIVITDKGYSREYFGDDAFYCDPGNPGSIREAVEKASAAGSNEALQQKITEQYDWQQAAVKTLAVYKKFICK